MKSLVTETTKQTLNVGDSVIFKAIGGNSDYDVEAEAVVDAFPWHRGMDTIHIQLTKIRSQGKLTLSVYKVGTRSIEGISLILVESE